MRSYGQYCSIAKALDVIGERWNLLIVRELLLRGPCRYTDLLDGLPGIATNLLGDRLRGLEEAGVIVREQTAPPVAATVFRVTPRGEELAPVLRELGRWGLPLMIEAPRESAFRSHWLALPVELFLADRAPERPPVAIEVRTGDEPVTIRAAGGEVRALAGAAERPDLVVTGTPHQILGVISGRVELKDARRRGLRWDGDQASLARVRAPAA